MYKNILKMCDFLESNHGVITASQASLGMAAMRSISVIRGKIDRP
jgi:hypothetical protein